MTKEFTLKAAKHKTKKADMHSLKMVGSDLFQGIDSHYFEKYELHDDVTVESYVTSFNPSMAFTSGQHTIFKTAFMQPNIKNGKEMIMAVLSQKGLYEGCSFHYIYRSEIEETGYNYVLAFDQDQHRLVWSNNDRRTDMVAITCGLLPHAINSGFDMFNANGNHHEGKSKQIVFDKLWMSNDLMNKTIYYGSPSNEKPMSLEERINFDLKGSETTILKNCSNGIVWIVYEHRNGIDNPVVAYEINSSLIAKLYRSMKNPGSPVNISLNSLANYFDNGITDISKKLGLIGLDEYKDKVRIELRGI